MVYNNFKDFQPLSIGEDEDFRSLMAEVEPRFCLLTRKYFWVDYNTCFLQDSFIIINKLAHFFSLKKIVRHADKQTRLDST